MIKFLDLYSQYGTIKLEIDQAISEVIRNSAFIGGENLVAFEREFAEYQQAQYCVGVGNGTDAIEIALEALDLPLGSEIIVPANSFIATSEAVTRSGHKVVFADVDAKTYTMSPSDLLSRITPNTSAIIAVHLYGHPCEMDEIMEIGREFDLKVLEDCAQAHGAKYKGKRVGVLGHAGTFSFYPGKNLGAYGDGGAILSNDGIFAKRCRMIANHGRCEKYNHQFEGRNSRLDGLQAAVLRVKLRHLDEWIERRNEIGMAYNEKMSGVGDLVLPTIRKDCLHAFHLFVIRTSCRNELAEHLRSKGIQTGIHYPIALPKLQAYAHLGQQSEPMFANRADETLLSLPIGEHLDMSDVQNIVIEVSSFFANQC